MSEHYVIGEGVILDVRPASFLSRAMAVALDFVVLALIVFVAIRVLDFYGLTQSDSIQSVGIILLVLLLVVIPATVETLSRGRSLGKLACGIRVVRDDGGPVNMRHAFIRAMVGVGEVWLTAGSLALIVSVLNDKGKRIGDALAGTYVIRTRTRTKPAAPLHVSPAVAEWSATAEITKLPDGLALSARQFLDRRFTLSPQTRAAMGQSIYASISKHVAPAPPFNVHPEEFIAAIVLERTTRDVAFTQERQRQAEQVTKLLSTLPQGIPLPKN